MFSEEIFEFICPCLLSRKEEMALKELTSKLIDRIISECRKDDNMTQIQLHILDPLIQYTFGRLYPYIIITSIVF